MSRAVLLLAGVLGWADGGLAAAAPGMGEYRAVLTLPAGELPFGLELRRCAKNSHRLFRARHRRALHAFEAEVKATLDKLLAET